MHRVNRVRFPTILPCRSGIKAKGHRLYVVAVMQEDDGGAWMGLERVWALEGARSGHNVMKRLDPGEIIRLQVEAEQEWEKAVKAGIVEGG